MWHEWNIVTVCRAGTPVRPLATDLFGSSLRTHLSQGGGGAGAAVVGLLFTKTSVIIKFTIAMVMFLVGTTGNGFMVYVIWKSPHLRSNTNILMVWLIIADILVGFTGALYIGIYQLVAFVISGNPCRFIGIVASAFVFPIVPNMAAVAILVVIAVDRYIAIVHPFQYAILVTDRRINLAIVACWAYGLFFGVVHAVYLYRVDFSSCAPPYSMVMESVIDNSNYIAITLLMIFMYGRIFKVAMDQRNKIEADFYVSEPAGESCNIQERNESSACDSDDSRYVCYSLVSIPVWKVPASHRQYPTVHAIPGRCWTVLGRIQPCHWLAHLRRIESGIQTCHHKNDGADWAEIKRIIPTYYLKHGMHLYRWIGYGWVASCLGVYQWFHPRLTSQLCYRIDLWSDTLIEKKQSRTFAGYQIIYFTSYLHSQNHLSIIDWVFLQSLNQSYITDHQRCTHR